jgi:hypothetical protein
VISPPRSHRTGRIRRAALAQLMVRYVAMLTIVSPVLLLSIDRPSGVGVEPPVVLTDLHDVEALRVLFNQDAGRPRLLLLLSPT